MLVYDHGYAVVSSVCVNLSQVLNELIWAFLQNDNPFSTSQHKDWNNVAVANTLSSPFLSSLSPSYPSFSPLFLSFYIFLLLLSDTSSCHFPLSLILLPFLFSLSLSSGITSLIRLLSSASEESQPGLGVLLCEILTAVFLSLFVHGMATHSSNELFRIIAHPLNSKLWVTVFGGGAWATVREKPNSPTKISPPGWCRSFLLILFVSQLSVCDDVSICGCFLEAN